VFMRVLRDLLRDGGIYNKNVVDSASRRIDIANKSAKKILRQAKRQADYPTWECFVPNLGTFHSHRGKVVFH